MNTDFATFMSQLKETNQSLDFFCDFKKIKSNINEIRLSLCMLNSLIGIKDIRKGVETIWNRDKSAFQVLDILIAVRSDGKKLVLNESGNVVPLNQYFESVDGVVEYLENTGLKDLFVNRTIKDLNDYVQMKDVWHLPSIAAWEKDCGKHPTQKPLCLLVRAILASTKENSWILDPFSGSGTTGIAANLLNRRYLGLEICREYLDMSKNRRQSLDIPEIRSKHIEKLIAAKAAPAHVFGDVVGESEPSYGVPWL